VLIVLDTNVYVSHLLMPHSVPDKVVKYAFRNHTVLVSTTLLTELRNTLSRKKFDVYVSMRDRQKFLHKLQKIAAPVEIIQRIAVCRDADDNAILEIAVNGQAAMIISGDKDLLALHPFRGIDILTPAQFL